jgi:HAD superfamily hydrolase (TIGR01509 family)
MSSLKIPLVAFVGLPNSGKSTLTNRFSENKKAIVAQEAHTTRDLNYGECEWDGKYFRIVDTGGLVPDPEGKIQKAVQIKSWGAIAEADMLVWVIDRKQNIATISDETINRIRRTGKPYIIAINKVDDPNLDTNQGDYAHLGGLGFINISCNIGYGLGDLADLITKTLESKGFATNLKQLPEVDILTRHKHEEDRRLKKVERKLDGTYVIRGADGIFESINEKRELEEESKIENLVFDWYRVVFSDGIDASIKTLTTKYDLTQEQQKQLREIYIKKYEFETPDAEFAQELVDIVDAEIDYDADIREPWNSLVHEIKHTTDFLKFQKSLGKKIYYITNIGNSLESRKESDIFKYFDGGVASCEVGLEKPDHRIYRLLLKTYKLKARNCLFIDDMFDNVEAAKAVGMKGIVYKDGETDLYRELKILEGRNPNPPKILFLGKPNVGKSSLFNTMVGEEIQIVTDVAGTTLSVNDIEIERTKKLRVTIPVKIAKTDVEYDMEDLDSDLEEDEEELV